MLKEIISFWKGESFMGELVKEFGGMIGNAEIVFTKSWEAITNSGDLEALKKMIYEKDKAVNHTERDIRRKLMEHLSINPQQDTSGCLAIMSLVKDVERIGDYAKNIFDLRVMLERPIKDFKYSNEFKSIHSKIAGHFPSLKKAFLESDGKLAREILLDYAPIKEECNKILKDLFVTDLNTQEAVGSTLLTRYLKRINSHISNVATGIISPVDQIDFVRGDLLE